ncbi:MAG: DNA repair exonuclease [Ectothiorhodospiraceae bacterium]|nr:DNA repair exonuclease [Ectothiorhodospiraceae bacterium]
MRLLHTADWQLGLKLRFLSGEAAARLRAQRFDTIRHMAGLARERAVDLVVVSGDVFDDNGVGGDTLQQASDALRTFGDIPVLLIPGNHDPATPDSALHRMLCPDNVRVATEREPLVLAGAAVYPCPLSRRHERDDPTAWLPRRETGEGVRIAVAHGGAMRFGESTETPNLVDVQAVLSKGFDYLALGDWHGVYRVDDRAWYPGTPEATRFKEQAPGYALLVDIDGPGATPRVEQVPVARTRWLRHAVDFHEDAQVDELEHWLEALPERSWTLLELRLTGQLSLSARARLDHLLEDQAERLAYLRLAVDQVQAEPTAGDLERLSGEGFIGEVAEVLLAGEDPGDRDALRLLHRLMQEVGRCG